MNKKFLVTVNGETYEVEVEEIGGAAPAKTRVQQPAPEPAPGPRVQPKPQARPKPQAKPRTAAPAGSGTVVAPITGKIIEIKVNEGDSVEEGDLLLTLEAMKMENEIFAPVSGEVKSIEVSKGQSVDVGDILVVIE